MGIFTHSYDLVIIHVGYTLLDKQLLHTVVILLKVNKSKHSLQAFNYPLSKHKVENIKKVKSTNKENIFMLFSNIKFGLHFTGHHSFLTYSSRMGSGKNTEISTL